MIYVADLNIDNDDEQPAKMPMKKRRRKIETQRNKKN